MAKKMGPVFETKAHVRLLSECQFQNGSSVVRGNTLHYTDGYGPRGIQGDIAQAGIARGISMWLPSRGPETPEQILYECAKYNSIRDRLREPAFIEEVTVGFLGAERVLQRLRVVCGQNDVTETGRRATPQTIVVIVRNRTLK
jgi:hypothetical protein